MDEIEYGWPGDGGGSDDLADYNQKEADDYNGDREDEDRDLDSTQETDWDAHSPEEADCLLDE